MIPPRQQCLIQFHAHRTLKLVFFWCHGQISRAVFTSWPVCEMSAALSEVSAVWINAHTCARPEAKRFTSLYVCERISGVLNVCVCVFHA